MVGPDYKRPLRILRDPRPRYWTSKSQLVDFVVCAPLIVLADIPACPSNLCRYWGPLLGENLP